MTEADLKQIKEKIQQADKIIVKINDLNLLLNQLKETKEININLSEDAKVKTILATDVKFHLNKIDFPNLGEELKILIIEKITKIKDKYLEQLETLKI